MLTLFSTLPASATDPRNITTVDTTSGKAAVEYACAALKLDCPEFDHYPLIVTTAIYPGYQGVYVDGIYDVIFVSNQVPIGSVDWASTIRHEATHWLDMHLQLTGMEPCATEALAWYVSNIYDIENGGKPNWEWWKAYECAPITVEIL